MSIKLLTEHHLEFLGLKGGCTILSESTHVKMPHCWKSLVTAHKLFTRWEIYIIYFSSANFLSFLLLKNSKRLSIILNSDHDGCFFAPSPGLNC